MSSAAPAAKPFAIRWRDAVLSPSGPAKPTTKLVLLALLKFMNSDGSSCFPSVETLAAATSTSRRTICTHTAQAQAEGWLRIESRSGCGQAWRRYRYVPLMPAERGEAFSQPCTKGSERGSPRSAKGGENDDRKVVNLTPKGGERVSLYQPIDQSIDQSIDHGGAAQGGRRGRARATRLSDSFAPDATGRAKAAELGLDVDHELSKFRDHAAATGRTLKDWQAGFRMWLTKANEFGRGQPAAAGRPSQRRVSPSDYEITSYD